MNREEIKTILPHRGNMLLVDDIEMIGDECVSHYTIKGNEPFLDGHFPSMPIVPGVILCEIMGQGSVLHVQDLLDGTTVPMFVGLDNVKFKQKAVPGDTLECRARLVERKGNIVFIDSKATINGVRCCSATLKVAIVKIGE